MLITNFKLKYLLYRAVCGWYQLLDVGRVHPVRERSLRALQRTVDYIEMEMRDALGLENQRDLIKHALSNVEVDGHYLEFGVFTGGTIRFMARRVGGRTIHGFDSFEGLPDQWSGFSLPGKAFTVGGRLPRVPRNVVLHRGWFDQSLPEWLGGNPGSIAFVHIDCDLYSSTKIVLEALSPRLVSGTLLLFDEYFNYPNWEQHEFKAFQEFVKARGIRYSYLAFARQQVLVRIDAVGAKNPMIPANSDAKVLMTPAAERLRGSEVAADGSAAASIDLSLFVSCYNESDLISKTLDTVLEALADVEKISYELIIIDDCSRDESVQVIEKYVGEHPEECIVFRRNAVNLGWAQNYLDAAFLGRGKYYRVICGDNSEPKETMVSVFNAIGAADILIPYYATSEGRSTYRLMVSGIYTRLVNMLSGFRLHYYNGLPLHLRYNVMRWHSNTRGFGFQADILCLLLEQGFTYKEIPVTTIEHKGGDSTAITSRNLLSVGHTLFDILVRRIANWIYNKRRDQKRSI